MRIKYNAPFTLTFTLICVIITTANVLTRDPQSTFNGILDNFTVLRDGFDFFSFSDYMQLIFYIFNHGSYTHLVGNLSFILLLGPLLEDRYGVGQMFAMVGLTSLCTALLNNLLFNSGIVGASGIVFMFIILVSFTNVEKGQIPMTFLAIMIIFLGSEIWQATEEDNISQFAHILGGICGGIFGFIKSHKSVY